MPKYFFHVYHNEPEIDYEGEELPDKHAAWREAWFWVVYWLPEGWEGVGEDIKHLCFAAGMAEPRKYGSWGAMVSGTMGKMLEHKDGGVWGTPVDVPSHASAKRILRKTGLV